MGDFPNSLAQVIHIGFQLSIIINAKLANNIDIGLAAQLDFIALTEEH
jgi:hypothetical protein